MIPEDLSAIVRRHMAVLFVVQALSIVPGQAMAALGGVMVLHLTGNVALTGLALSVNSLGQVLTAYPAGRLMDRYGRRAVLVAGGVASVAGTVLIAWTFAVGSLAGLGAAVLLFGAGSGSIRQVTIVAGDLYPPEQRGRAVGLLLMGNVAGSVIAPAITAAVARPGVPEATSITLTWIAGAALLALTVPMLLFLRPDPLEIARLRRDDPAPDAAPAVAADGLPGRRVAVAAAIVTSAVVWGAMALAMALTPVALHEHGHELSRIVLAVSIHVAGMYAFGVPLGALADRLGRRPLLLAALATSAAGTFGAIAAVAYIPSTALLFVVGVGWSAGVVAASALLADCTAPEERGRVFGLSEFVARAATLAFPVLGGWLVDAWGFAAAGACVAAVVLAPTLLVLRLPAGRAAPAPATE